MRSGWIGVDLDGTLAEWTKTSALDSIGPPIPLMVDRVLGWLSSGINVRIMTARVAVIDYSDLAIVDHQRKIIEEWCVKNLGQALPITATKDYTMVELWDDRAITVETNTGRILDAANRSHRPESQRSTQQEMGEGSPLD